jgi:GMP synthase-like glutamine amidotransferase
MATTVKRFCIINCEDSVKWSPRNFPDMFREGLSEENDIWVTCNAASGEPLPTDILEYDGAVLTGSHYNCRDRSTLPWFDSVCNFIRSAASSGSPRIYGGCFGCQIIAFALGGVVDFNPDGSFAIKAENVVVNENFKKYFAADSEEKWYSTGANIIVSHGDCVLQLPPNATNLGSSNSCQNEIYICGSANNILACQSHPEFDYEYAIKERVWPAVVDTRKRLNEHEIELSLETFSRFDGQDSKKFLHIISRFLRKN